MTTVKNKSFAPSQRVQNVSEYYFSVKLAEVARLNAEGKNIISLGVGAPDKLPPLQSIEKLREVVTQTDVHAYQPYSGIPELRKAYADWYKKTYRVDLDSTNVLPLIGSKEGILHISMAFLNPGDGVLIPNPGYPTYESVSNLLDANIITYNLTEDNNWNPDFQALEKEDLSNVKLMWVNYPNMPTGAPATEELFEKLVAFGRKHQIIICHDNPYSFILNDKPMSILSVEGAMDYCIELNSLSKSHNMSGWRMGMLATNPQFLQWILKVKSNIDSGQFRPMQLAAIEALNVSSEWHHQMNAIYKERRYWAEKIMTLLGCTFNPSQIGLFVWGKLPAGIKDSKVFIDMILYSANVFITPGAIFGTNGNSYIRISLGSDAKKIEEAYNRIQNKLSAIAECE